MKFGVDMTFTDLSENEKACEVFDRYLPGVRQMVTGNPKVGGLSIRNIVRYMGGRIPLSVLDPMDAELQALNATECRISPREAAMIAQFKVWDAEDKAKTQLSETHVQTAIVPGAVWYDTQGKVIQAHGAAVIYDNGTYYWYGENKEHTDGKNGVWTWGIRLYSSTDLYNWKDLGLIIEPDLEDPDSNLFPTKCLDRPHVLRCPATGKLVMWIKLSGAGAVFMVFEADAMTGPWTLVKDDYRPQEADVGDFDMICDEATGEGYLYYTAQSTPHATVSMRLSEDFLSAKEEVARQYVGMEPPFTREGPALFEIGGKKYLFTSGMTGYIPNRSDLAVSDAWDQPFVSIGNPHVDDASNASFNSQISKVFRVEGTDLWISMADRWVTDYVVDARRADAIERAIASRYDPEHYHATPEEYQEMENSPDLEKADTGNARYIWLPVTFAADGTPQLEWKDSWRVEEYI